MSLARAQRERLLEYHHIARHCRARDMVNGMPRENAFRLRPGEEYLSTDVAALLAQSVNPNEIYPAAL